MKNLSVLFVALLFTAYVQGQSFTNKAEATNQTVNAQKQGKWVEYFKIKKGIEVDVKSKTASIYRLTIYKDDMPTGTVCEYLANGQLWSETTYTDNHVSMLKYYADGHLLLKDSIDATGRGALKTFYDDGFTDMEFPFTISKTGGVTMVFNSPVGFTLQGSIHGPYRELHDSTGQVYFDFLPYVKDTDYDNLKSTCVGSDAKHFRINMSGHLTGLSNGYYKSGGVQSSVVFENGDITVIRDYYKNGVLETEMPMQKGKLNDTMKIYYTSGKIECVIPKTDNEINGVETHYYENGTISREFSFKNSKLNGISKYYQTNGKLEHEVTYVKGIMNGPMKVYYDGVKIKMEIPYADGKVNGIETLYYQNGDKQQELGIKNNVLDGVAMYYRENGTLEQKITYVNGKQVSTTRFDENGKAIN